MPSGPSPRQPIDGTEAAPRRATSDPWLVPVTRLRRHTGLRREEHRSGALGGLVVGGTTVPAEAPVAAEVTLDSVQGGIEVAASIRAPWQAECRRCLRRIDGELSCQVRELYRPRSPEDAVDEDEDTYPLEGDYLDLRPLVRDAVLLELPLAPLCRPDCQGLCPECGADRNTEACQCGPGATDPRWVVLDQLRVGDNDPDLPG